MVWATTMQRCFTTGGRELVKARGGSYIHCLDGGQPGDIGKWQQPQIMHSMRMSGASSLRRIGSQVCSCQYYLRSFHDLDCH